MLSSVSIVCSGMCAGMWVISRVFILGCKSRSFISVSLIQRSFSVMNKEELVELLAKSQECSLERVDSKLQVPFLKIKKTAYDQLLKRLKRKISLSGRKLESRSN